ncbi:nucleotidyltransferase domain-containing protein [Saccharibacillus alkalitolerans]|uniref:Aminoglycoside adenylyltransferase n=1 Tax=Saccharibacillus alkalitolerans TaxID=2705290 RepID=A0ABX0F8R8_9BACL|nr:hypothetical protein [Saccharibacillus alkalitolerans]NGZ77348.1 hypothetical protein [Saccharibacillus alkalitolerans]
MQTLSQTEKQLGLLREIGDLFDEIGEPFWLRGGWAIDFRVGRVLREHDDLDLVAMLSAERPIAGRLEAAGFESIVINDKQIDYRKNGVDVQILYLTHAEDGSLVPDGIPEWIWMPDCLDPRVRRLNGTSARSLTPRQLLAEKLDYERIGRPKREKDAASKELLRRLIDEER